MARWNAELADVSEADIEGFVAALRDSGRAPASVARTLVAVRALHRFAASEGGLTTDPTVDVALPRVPAGLPKPLSEADVTMLLDSVVGLEPADRRDRAALETLYATGMRISELVGLSLGAVDLDQCLLRVFGKGAKERIVPIGQAARRALSEWLSPSGRGALEPTRRARRGDAEAVFLNQRGGRLSRQGRGGSCASTATGSDSAIGCRRTYCAIRARPTCSITAPTCVSFRSSSGMRRYRRRRCTPRSLRSACERCTTVRTPAPAVARRPPLGSVRSLVNSDLARIVLSIGVIIFSLVLHELAHATVALWCGDDTAKRAGRISLNPACHLDPFGSVVLPLILAASSLGVFGYAKPVPIAPRRMRSPRNQALLVALAGPAMNLLLAMSALDCPAHRHARHQVLGLDADGPRHQGPVAAGPHEPAARRVQRVAVTAP